MAQPRKPQARMSFRESRKAILRTMTANAKGDIEERVIRFQNDDVPLFLQTLDAYEAKSRQVKIACK